MTKYLLHFVLLLSLTTILSCNRTDEQILQPAQLDQCSILGTIDVDKCGPFIQLDNGLKIQSKRDMATDFQVKDIRVAVSYMKEYEDNGDDSNSHDCGNGNDQANAKSLTNDCGETIVTLNCIRLVDK